MTEGSIPASSRADKAIGFYSVFRLVKPRFPSTSVWAVWSSLAAI